MGKLLKQLMVALGQAISYRIARMFGRGQAPPAPPMALMPGVPLRIDLGCGTKKRQASSAATGGRSRASTWSWK